jgi:hypothetical protein
VKSIFLLAAFFVAARAAAGPASPPAPEPVGRVLQAGIYARSGPVVKYLAPGTPSGLSSRHLGPSSLITATNRIPAALGINFGFVYEVTNLPDTPGKLIEFVYTAVSPP